MPRGTILVVDDDRSIQEMVQIALEDQGYRVFTAVDGEAVTVAREGHPDLVLLDASMPNFDGIEISKRLRGQRATKEIPIVAMTALPAQAKRAGMLVDDWLPKPFDLDTLYETVARWMNAA